MSTKAPAWLHPATLRWVANEMDAASIDAEFVQRRVLRQDGHEQWSRMWGWLAKERRGWRRRLRLLATRAENRRDRP